MEVHTIWILVRFCTCSSVLWGFILSHIIMQEQRCYSVWAVFILVCLFLLFQALQHCCHLQPLLINCRTSAIPNVLHLSLSDVTVFSPALAYIFHFPSVIVLSIILPHPHLNPPPSGYNPNHSLETSRRHSPTPTLGWGRPVSPCVEPCTSTWAPHSGSSLRMRGQHYCSR